MKMPVFEGSCTALITPFTAEGIDFAALRSQLERQVIGQTAAVVIAGTTGEHSTLSRIEFERLTDFVIRTVAGRMKTIVCVGGNNTAECLSRAKFAENAGADATLMTAPYYNKSSSCGLIAHFSRVAEAASIPLILYNVPGRTGIGIPAEIFNTLSRHPNINGVKEASGDFSLISRIAAECGNELFIWSGNDEHTIPVMALGGRGVISVLSNLLPGYVAALCKSCLAGDYAAARAMSNQYEALTRSLFLEPNPIPVKAAMAKLGLDSGILRLPLVQLSELNQEKLQNTMVQCGLI